MNWLKFACAIGGDLGWNVYFSHCESKETHYWRNAARTVSGGFKAPGSRCLQLSWWNIFFILKPSSAPDFLWEIKPELLKWHVFKDSWTSTLQTIGQNLSSYTEYQQQRRYCVSDCFFPFVGLAAILGTHAGLTTVINTICIVCFFSGLQKAVNRDMDCLCGQCKASVTSKHPLFCFSTVRRYILQTWKDLWC